MARNGFIENFVRTRLAIIILATGVVALMPLHHHQRVSNAANPVELSVDDSTPRPGERQLLHVRSHLISSFRQTFPNPDPTATDEEFLTSARTLVDTSAQDAIAWARSQDDETLRRRCLCAVIRAWGEREPVLAVDWALAQDEIERQRDVEAALDGAAKQPEQAVAIVRGLLKYYDPSDSVRAAPALMVALNNAGEFAVALDFIKGTPADLQVEWTTATFQRWGASQPQQAIEALNSLSDEKLRTPAFEAFIASWSAGQPASAADYAASLPEGVERTYALNKIADSWALQDPVAFATWLANPPLGVNLDHAIVALITRTDSANRSSEIALEWAQGISDPDLKQDSIKWILAESGQSAPAN